METTVLSSLTRHSPLPFPGGLRLKNRVVVPPMASGTASEEGFVTGATLEHYANLAESCAGLLFVEYSYVHPSGKSEANQLGAHDHSLIPGLTELARTIKNSGALAGLQLVHSGGKSDSVLTGGQLMGPSAISVPVKGDALEVPRRMTSADVLLWKSSFVSAIGRAALAGFDLVELHAAHGYGLNQFLSPVTNQRHDEYGGSLENRTRLLLEIVAEAKRLYPELLLSVRMPGQDFLPHGLSQQDAIELAQKLEASGVHVLNISSGIGGWRRPAPRIGEGYLVSEAELIQAAVEVPVIGVGGIESGTYIDESLRLRRFSLAAVGRAILKEPKAWGESNLCLCS